MKGKVVIPVAGEGLQAHSRVSFSCNQSLKDEYITFSQNGKKYHLPLGCVEALEAENLEDIEYLDILSKELEKHDSLLVFTGGGTALGYVYGDELTSRDHKALPALSNFTQREVADRRLYKNLVLRMAVEDGLKVYAACRFNAVQLVMLRIGREANRHVGGYNNIEDVVLAFREMKERNDWV